MFVVISEDTAVNPEHITHISEYRSGAGNGPWFVRISYSSGTDTTHLKDMRLVDVVSKLQGETS